MSRRPAVFTVTASRLYVICMISAYDIGLFRSIHGAVGTSALLDAAGLFAARYLIFVIAAVPVWLCIVPVLRSDRLRGRRLISRLWSGRAIVWRATAASILAFAGNQVIALIHFRPRPFVTFPDIVPLIGTSASFKSFPSDHAAIAFALAVSVSLVRPRWGPVLIGAASLVALGRVFVGVHYPLDILVGAVCGAAWALVVWIVEGPVRRNRRAAAG